MYCWGNNRFEQLGLADPGDIEVHFKENDFFQDKAGIQKVACGGQHTIFVLDDGSVFSCGQNSNGQLGRRTKISSADQILALEAQTIVDASCGLYHSVSVCNEGNVFTWGEGTEGELGTGQMKQTNAIPRRISGLSNSKIIQISCGHFHSIALSEDGRVFSWGSNKAGQLGLGKEIPNQAGPQIVKSLHGIPLVQIIAGGCQSFALSMLGTVLAWGKNKAGQLGFKSAPSKDCVFKPYAVSSVRNLGVTYISCGDEHTAVLTKDGSVYTFGDDTYGQLGLRTRNTTSVPQKLEDYEGQVVGVACGSYHTLIYTYKCNRVVSFGRGSQSESDNTSKDDQAKEFQQPQEFNISSLVSSKDHTHVKWIFAGNNISFIHCTNQQQNPKQTSVTDNLQKISRINLAMANKWMKAKPGSEEYQETKREINTIFSSPSCLTASFLKNSTSNPDPTTNVQLDLEAARKIFANLQTDPRISEIICASLKSDLIPGLDSLPVLYEALSVFILFPELPIMHLPENILQFIIPFTNAINNLSGNATKILGSMWSSITALALTRFIELLKLAVLLGIQTDQEDSKIKSPLEVMKILYRVNMKAKCIVPIQTFCIDNLFLNPLDIAAWRTWQSKTGSDENVPVIYCCYPFIFSFSAKVQILHFDSLHERNVTKIKAYEEIMQNRLQGRSDLPKIPVFHLKVRRSNLVEDTLHKLSIAEDSDFKKDLLIESHGEPVTKPPMAAKEFFLLIFDAMINPDYGMFFYPGPLSTTMWFPVSPKMAKKKYFYFGILCGLAVFNQTVSHLPFPLALFKKLLGKKTTLDDLITLDPIFGRSLQIILSSNEVDNLQLYFRLSWGNKTVDLIPNGTSLPVTNSNKNEYVDKCIDYIFNTSMEEIFEEFKRGLYKVCDSDILSFFQPDELMSVVAGTEIINWDAFEKGTVYQGKYTKDHPTIGMFWKVFRDLPVKDKRAFLLFVNGNAKAPPFGLENGIIRITNLWVPDESFLPEAEPCFNLLLLPDYSSIKILKKKLLFAIQNCAGYEKI